MAKYSQKEVVYSAISAFMHESGRQWDDGDKVDLSPEDRKTITTMIVAAIDVGEMEFSAEARAKHNTPEKVRNYSTGLLSNWLRKDPRLNGGEKHSIKNPGSRVGQDDNVVKALRQLRKELTVPKEIAAVDSEIELRLTQLRNDKIKSTRINIDNIPAHLLHLVKH
jgi:hypothetical protein